MRLFLNIVKYLNANNLFKLIVTGFIFLVFISNPFMKFPYDMHHHLIHIDRFFYTSNMPDGRWVWHFLWAKVFYLFGLDNSDFLYRANVIHITQTFISLFCVYFFSNVVIRNLFKEINEMVLKYLSLWSVIIWLTIFATFSMYHQNVWLLWYSVNYQITLPFFLLITGMTLVLFLEQTTLKKKLLFIVLILLISRFILQAHSMEYMYYLMYLVVLLAIFIDRAFLIVKKHYFIIIPIVLVIIFFMQNYQPETSKIFKYMSYDKLPILFNSILYEGTIVTNGFNRAEYSLNELVYLTFFLGLSCIVFFIKNLKKNKDNINLRMLVFLIVTSLFFIIPLTEFTAGLFAIITHIGVVNRIFYSSSLFILLPVVVYYFINNINSSNVLRNVNIIMLLIILVVYIYSKYLGINKNYYKNIQSIKNSFFEDKVGFHLNEKQISKIGNLVRMYENKEKNIHFYARTDIAYIIKYVYKKSVYWEERRKNIAFKEIYLKHKKEKKSSKRKLVLFETPKGFPDYIPYK